MTMGRPAKGKDAGFTLVELMVVLAITLVFATIATVGYRQGVYREYALSQQTRSLVNALHVAQWRALQNKISVIITTGTSTDSVAGTDWYKTVTFVTATDHNFVTGDTAIFANLNSHLGMNVGRYYVTYLNATSFRCDYYTQVAAAAQDTDPGSGSTARPAAMNMRTTSQLILMKQSFVDAHDNLTVPTKAELLNDPQNFIYNDVEMRLWDGTNTTLTEINLDDSTYQFIVAFDSRGFPTNPAGYQIAVGKAPANLKTLKYITISPTGKISPGA
jgi:prepilin-type N-terminal cleavage/methylation domain-containing protein